ncbi:MAG: hypothetical protein RI906_1980 [Pseudomonadota bacterium]|jgi:hypothetical protein
MRKFIGVSLGGVIAALLSACGGGGGTPAQAPGTIDLSGSAYKGLLVGADVSAYALVNGVAASTPLATTKTDDVGDYVLKIPPTAGPVIIEVKANSNTQMLAEDEYEADGRLKRRPVGEMPPLRGFVLNDEKAASAMVSMHSESAVQIAMNSSTDKKLTSELLNGAAQAVRQLAPVDPFTVKPPVRLFTGTGETAEVANADQIKLMTFNAGLLKGAASPTGCAKSAITCAIEGMSKQATVAINGSKVTFNAADGKPLDTDALRTFNAKVLSAGETAVSSAVDKIKTTDLDRVLRRVQTFAAATATENLSRNFTTEIKLAATTSIEGFVTALRDGLVAAETRLETLEANLDSRYGEQNYGRIASDAVSKIQYLFDSIKGRCKFTSGQLYCPTISTGANQIKPTPGGPAGSYDFLQSPSPGSDFTTSLTVIGEGSFEGGYTVTAKKGSVVLTPYSSSLSTSAAQPPYVAKVADVTLVVPSDNDQWPKKGKMSGVLEVFDEKTWSKPDAQFVKFELKDIDLDMSSRTASLEIWRVKGELAVSTSWGDRLAGRLNAGVHTFKRSTPFYSNIFEDYSDVVQDLNFGLLASQRSEGVLSIAASFDRSVPYDPFKAVSASNYEGGVLNLTLAVSEHVSLSIGLERPTYEVFKATIDINASGNKASLSATTSAPERFPAIRPSNRWCIDAGPGYVACTDKMSMKSGDGLYTGTLTRAGGKTQGEIKNAQGVVVGKIKDGVVEIDGTYYSLL